MVCALVPVHELFVTRLEVSTENLTKLEPHSHLLTAICYCCDIYIQDGWDPEQLRDQCKCCKGEVVELHTSHVHWVIDDVSVG